MNMVQKLLNWRRFGIASGCLSLALWLNNPFSLSGGWAFLAGVLVGVPLTVLLLKVYDSLTAGAAGNLIYQSGGKAKLGYSLEKGMAMKGEREAACEALRLRYAEARDAEAMRVLVSIAIQKPPLDSWTAMGCQALLKDPRLAADERGVYEKLLGALHLDPQSRETVI